MQRRVGDKGLLVRPTTLSMGFLESSLAGTRYLDRPYRIILTKEKRTGTNAWLALVEELPGCEVRAESPEEATQALRDEMASWIANAIENGQPVPRPRHKPTRTDGRLSLEIPQSLHETVAHAAVREGLTIDQLVTIALAGVLRWRPGDDEGNARWIESRGDSLVSGDKRSRTGLRQALLLNVALLVLVAVVAVAVLIVAIAHGF